MVFNRKEYSKQYYKMHKAERKEYSEKYLVTHKEERKQYYEAHKDNYRKWRLKNKNRYTEYNTRYAKKYREENREEYNKKLRESYKTNPYRKIRRKAHSAVNYALRIGKLKKQSCKVCGDSNTVAHHCDYTKPLDIMWLCKEHHKEWHQKNKSIYPLNVDLSKNVSYNKDIINKEVSMEEEILSFIRENEPQISEERIGEIYDDMKPAILKGIEFAFRAWNEGIEKRSQDERFAKGAWKNYVTNCTTECLDHMTGHLVNILNNNHDEEHLAHLLSRCFMITHVGLFPEYKGLPRSIVLDTEERDNLNEVEGEDGPETSNDGE